MSQKVLKKQPKHCNKNETHECSAHLGQFLQQLQPVRVSAEDAALYISYLQNSCSLINISSYFSNAAG